MQVAELELQEADLTEANFFRTPLAGLDLTECRIRRADPFGRELRGVTVTAYQPPAWQSCSA
jgi:uncharacterized protein YjbI with pentapeptide repeats